MKPGFHVFNIKHLLEAMSNIKIYSVELKKYPTRPTAEYILKSNMFSETKYIFIFDMPNAINVHHKCEEERRNYFYFGELRIYLFHQLFTNHFLSSSGYLTITHRSSF